MSVRIHDFCPAIKIPCSGTGRAIYSVSGDREDRTLKASQSPAAGVGVEGVAFAEGKAEVAGELVEGTGVDVFGEAVGGFDEFVAAKAHFEDGDDFAFSAVKDVGVVGFVAGGAGLFVL